MYLLQGKLTAKAGQTEALADILIEASRLVSAAKGCRLYVIGKEAGNEHSVCITEIWESKADHDSSLKIEGVRALITKAMPLLAEAPDKGQEIELLGGFGM